MDKSEIRELMWEYLFEVVEEHLESGEPAALTQTFNRLIKEGYAPREAKRLVGFVVLRELMKVSNIKGFPRRIRPFTTIGLSNG